MKTNIITNNTIMNNVFKYICAVVLLLGTSTHAWGNTTVTLSSFGDDTDCTETWCDGGSFTDNGSNTWTANGYSVSSGRLVIGKGGENYLQTPNFGDNEIKSITVTWYGNTEFYLALQTTDGTELEAIQNPINESSNPATRTFTVSSGYAQLKLVGRRESGTNNARSTISSVVLVYGPPCDKSVTITKGTATNCTFDLSVSGEQTTCDGVSTTVTVSPTSGYGNPSVTQSGASAAPTISGSGNTWTVTYGANTTGTSTINVACSANNYTVTLDNQSATSAGSASISVTYGSNSNLSGTPAITVPTKTGYTFGGYYTAVAGGGSQIIAANGNVNTNAGSGTYTDGSKNWKYAGDITLYAKWTQSVTLDNESPTSAGSTSVTLTYNSASHPAIVAPTKTGYLFAGWWSGDDGTGMEIINTSGVLQANKLGYTGAGGVWTKDGATTLYAKWAQQRTLAVASVGNVVISATSPSVAEGSSTLVTPGTTVTLTHGDVTSPYTWANWNVYKTGDPTTTVTVTSNSFTMPDYDVTVSAFLYGDFVAFCDAPIITLVTSDGDPALVTSRNGINIMAVKTLTLDITNVANGESVTISGTGLHFYTDDGTRFSVASLTTPVTSQTLRVSYNPATAGDGSITEPRITVSVAGTSVNFDGRIKARNLPDKVALVAKANSTWMALPTPTSESNPGGTLVSVSDGVAYGPASVSYKLWPVRTVNSGYDRFGTATSSTPAAQYGDRLRFAALSNGNKGLWANNATDGTSISTANAIATLGAAGDAPNEWKVETRIVDGQFVYNLQTQQAKNTKYLRYWLAASGGAKWGTYGSGINDIYILPLEETTNADIKVMEWGTDEIAVSYPNRASCTAMTAQIGSEDAVTAVITSVGGDIYKISTSDPSDFDLDDNAGKTLTLAVTEGGAKQVTFQIPFIVTSSTTEASLRSITGNDAAKVTDIVVRNGGTLTTGTASGAFNDLYIYPGGKADISLDISLNNVYMRGGFSWLGGDYKHPQMNVASSKKISGIRYGGIYYDLYLDNSIYYMFALPKTVAVTAITNEENGADWDAWVKSYSGEGRASSPKVSGWSYVTSGNIERCAGYEIAIKPRLSRPYGVLRFPLIKNTAWSDEGSPTPSVTGWGWNDDAVSENNKGWNLLGNPYFAAYNNTALPGTSPSGIIQTKTLVEHKPDGVHWDGTYEWSTDAVKYFTIPRYTEYEYDDVRAFSPTPYKLDAFFPFFIQTNTGTVTFSESNKTLKLRKRLAEQTAREVMVDFRLTNGSATDVAGLTIGNQYSANFDMDDKEKTIQNGNATMKVYTLVGEFRTAFNSLPEDVAAQPIPVGYIAPQESTYSFSLVEDADYSEVEHVWLTDYEGSTVDLLAGGAYSFETGAGEFQERFAINVILKPENQGSLTGLDDADATQMPPQKFIYRDKMYILLNDVLFDATGKRVNEINK